MYARRQRQRQTFPITNKRNLGQIFRISLVVDCSCLVSTVMADLDKDAQFASDIRDQYTDDTVMTTAIFPLVILYSITSSHQFHAIQLEVNWSPRWPSRSTVLDKMSFLFNENFTVVFRGNPPVVCTDKEICSDVTALYYNVLIEFLSK
jgi:hypothetical protein